MQPLSSAVSLGKELYNTNSPSASPLTKLSAYVYVCQVYLPRLLFEGGVYFTQSFRLCSYYSMAVTIQGQYLFEEIQY